MSKLSPAQARVMSLLLSGQIAYQAYGCAVLVNGKRICNLDTMTALVRKGLAEEHRSYYWRATEQAKQEAGNGEIEKDR